MTLKSCGQPSQRPPGGRAPGKLRVWIPGPSPRVHEKTDRRIGLRVLPARIHLGSRHLGLLEGTKVDRDEVYGEQLSGKLTIWLRSWSTGDRGAQGVDGECADGEEGEEGFGEHDDRVCRKREQITTAPGLRFGRRGELG